MAKFRSELHIPIKKDELNFQDRQIQLWGDMESRMEQRRKEWENEFEKMRHDFFVLKPSEKRASIIQLDNNKSLFETDTEGRQKFKVRFDVSEFKPEEIQVKVQQSKIIVNARHEEKTTSSTVSREYSRQVDIPSNVDSDKLQCLLSRDGILTIEGPVQMNMLAREVMLPIQNDVTTKPLGVATPVKNPIITEPDGSRRLRLLVDVGEFNPEDIVVKTMEKKLIVHAEKQEKMTNRTLHKEFNKEYDLPDSVDPTTITAYIADDKQLTIEAPLKPAQTQRKAYNVTQSSNVRKVSVTKESAVTITDSEDRPMITISVHRR